MRESKTSIAQKALSRLGNNESIINIDEPKTASELLVAKWYDFSRTSLLSMANWNFAKARFLCPRISENPPFGEYEKQFQTPADYLRTVWFGTDKEDYELRYKERFSFEGDKILVDYEDDSLPLVYIRDVEDTGRFPAWFTHALTYYLALQMSNEENKNNTDLQALQQGFNSALKQAKSLDGQQSPTRIIRDEVYKTGYYDRPRYQYVFED